MSYRGRGVVATRHASLVVDNCGSHRRAQSDLARPCIPTPGSAAATVVGERVAQDDHRCGAGEQVEAKVAQAKGQIRTPEGGIVDRRERDDGNEPRSDKMPASSASLTQTLVQPVDRSRRTRPFSCQPVARTSSTRLPR